MKNIVVILIMVLFVFACAEDNVKMDLDVNQELDFEGAFRTKGSDENLFEEVTLKIANGFYETTTSLPFGYGAGKLEVFGSSISFIDTLFFPIPALYGPSYVLSGTHNFEFNGKELKIWSEKNVGAIEYNLRLKE
ncbi:hypothetical protein ACFSKL_19865 [Belliella marina]|uniref:Lipoprotein n=1 Tax=Belliella marina TaxID=1644146 RepID=A0ABW4VTH0_9BACT